MKDFRLIIIGILFCVLGSLSVSAQIRGYNIVVSVTPDHQDWNYKVGEKANFVVNVRKSGTSRREEKYHPKGWNDEMERCYEDSWILSLESDCSCGR